MAYEPIVLFSRRIDPRGVVELLRRQGRDVRITGPDDDWTQVIVTVKKAGLFRKAQVLTFGHDSAYYDGDDWPKQMNGMQGYFSNFPDAPTKEQVLHLIGTFQFSLSVPQHDLDIESQDDRLAILYSVCQHLDGVIFTPSSLRDAQGRVIFGARGLSNPLAEMPKMPPVDEIVTEAYHDEETCEIADPPSPERVARRALALTAVAARATLEIYALDYEDPEDYRKRLLNWFEKLDIGDELEPEEWKVLQRPVGGLEDQDKINAMWRVEGLGVLAWALQLSDLPPDDELIFPADLYQSMGILDVDIGCEILKSPNLRTKFQLDDMQIHFLMLHWRVRNYSLQPQPMNFDEFSRNCWIGSFDISTFRLIDSDLAIGDVAIGDADESEFNRVRSSAMERHLAINWLCGSSETYSETDTST